MYVEQPRMRPARGEPELRKVAITLNVHSVIPEGLLADVETWIHEFTEITMINLLGGYMSNSMATFRLTLLDTGQYWIYYTTIPHILTSLTGFSLFDLKPTYGDQFWQILQRSISPKEFKRGMGWNYTT